MRLKSIALSFAIVLTPVSVVDTFAASPAPVKGEHGMVVTAQHLASGIGVEVMKKMVAGIKGEAAALGREIEVRKPFPPRADSLSKRLVGCDALFGGGVLRMVQEAHHVIGGHGVIGVVRVHPMHSCNAKRLRRTQLLTVPSGTLSRPANSPWLMP